MKRYEAYKPSNLPWVAEIPSGWKISKNSQLFRESSELSEKGEEPLLSLSQYTGISYKSNAAKIGMREADSKIGYRVIHEDDIVMNIMLAWNGSTAVSPFDGIISPAYAVYRQRTALNPKYFHYLFRIPAICSYFESNSTGLIKSRLRLYSDIFMRLFSIFPPREEQDQIVRYLDWQVSKINRLIAAKRKEIDAIHDMEHLYIDHVFSEIANQKTIRLKYLVEQFVDCPHETPEYCKDGDYCVIRTADQDYGYLRSETLMYRLTESEYTNRIRRAPLNAGDIVYGREGERWGLACVIPESEKFCLGQRIMQFVCNKQMVTPEYVMWALNSSYVRNQGILDTMGSTSPHVNISTIINFRIPYTSREHQHTLVSKIECTMQKYRQLCERIENEIRLLHDLRTRLISDVVTGQVDVREIEVPEFERFEEVVPTDKDDKDVEERKDVE